MNHNPDILNRLVDLAVRLHPDSETGRLLCDAADEIYRLRALITEWIDAKDAMRQSPPSDITNDLATANAEDALRKAVGR